MSSEIDPMVSELAAAVWNDAIYETEGRGKSQRRLVKCLERAITARLTAAQPSREDIRKAVYNAGFKYDENFWTLWTDAPQSSIDIWLDAVTNAVMAVLSPEQGGE